MIFSLVLASAALTIQNGAHSNMPFSNTVMSAVERLPQSLSRYLDYPPGPGKLGFPRCLFENPFVANPNFWLRDVDFTCASPWNDSFGRLRAGTAITKRHVIFSKHFPISVGTRIAFVGEAGDVSHYSIKATKIIGTCDIMLGLLDYELTPDVHPAKVLPIDYDKWLYPGSHWPVVTLNQFEQASLTQVSCETNIHPGEVTLWNDIPKDPNWRKLNKPLISGDSGSPAFLLYKGQPILLYCAFLGGAGKGPVIHKHRQKLQRAMDEMCPGYRLECFQFSEEH